VDYRGGRFHHPVWERLRYVRSFYAIIDLMAVLPSLLGLLGSGDLRVLRLLRLLRMPPTERTGGLEMPETGTQAPGPPSKGSSPHNFRSP
jgi:hypothetical protein